MKKYIYTVLNQDYYKKILLIPSLIFICYLIYLLMQTPLKKAE